MKSELVKKIGMYVGATALAIGIAYGSIRCSTYAQNTINKTLIEYEKSDYTIYPKIEFKQ